MEQKKEEELKEKEKIVKRQDTGANRTRKTGKINWTAKDTALLCRKTEAFSCNIARKGAMAVCLSSGTNCVALVLYLATRSC